MVYFHLNVIIDIMLTINLLLKSSKPVFSQTNYQLFVDIFDFILGIFPRILRG